MLKQKKNLIIKTNQKNKIQVNLNKFIKFKTQRKKNFKLLKKIQRIQKNRPIVLNNTFQKFTVENKISYISKIISIKVTSNNIFCIVKDLKKNLVLIKTSSGTYKIKTSRKKLRYSAKIVLFSFFNEMNSFVNSNDILLISLVAPIRIRKQLIKQTGLFFKNTKFFFVTKEQKCFNGCRPQKKKRKKQKNFSIFK